MLMQTIIEKVIKFLDREKEVYVIIRTRDENGCVIDKKIYPISAVFGHWNDSINIYCEESDVITDHKEL